MGLATSLAVALLVIAFLLGRESTRSPVVEASVSAPPFVEPEPIVQDGEPRRWPEWADLEEWEDVKEAGFPAEPVGERIEQRRDSTPLLANLGSAVEKPQAAHAAAGSAVAAYFLRMDGFHAQSGAGDPKTFAMGLIKAGLEGSTAGFDQLIADTRRMEEQIRRVTPPPCCVDYHEANLAALAESRKILDEMKRSFAKRDFSGLSAVAQKAGTLQSKAQALQDMRKQIMADAKR